MSETVLQKAGITCRVVKKLLPISLSKPSIYAWINGKGVRTKNRPYYVALIKAAECGLEQGVLPVESRDNDRYEQYLRTLVIMKKLVVFPPTQ